MLEYALIRSRAPRGRRTPALQGSGARCGNRSGTTPLWKQPNTAATARSWRGLSFPSKPPPARRTVASLGLLSVTRRVLTHEPEGFTKKQPKRPLVARHYSSVRNQSKSLWSGTRGIWRRRRLVVDLVVIYYINERNRAELGTKRARTPLHVQSNLTE
jgi:hypothetical protein